MTPEIKKPQKYLDKHLFTRLRCLIILSIILVLTIFYEMVINGFDVLTAIISLILGYLVGLIVSRMFHLSWDTETYQVVSNMDWIGAVIFVFYLIFMISRSILVGYWVQGTTYLFIIICITAGVMIGRIMGTRHSIVKIRKDLEKIIKINP